MNRPCLGVALLAVLCALRVSHAEPGGEPLRHEVIVPAPVADVWRAFATGEGLREWMVPLAEVDLRPGGLMRTNYDPAGIIGDDKTIENEIVCFEPERMLALRVHKPPKGFPFAEAVKDTWSVVRFEPVGSDRTRLICTGLGYGNDVQSQRARDFFDKGNAWTLDELRDHFSGDQAQAAEDESWRLLRTLVGGEWIHEMKRADGTVFRARSLVEEGAGGACLVSRGWLGNQDGMYPHAATQVWNEPGVGVFFQNINQTGSVTRGRIRPAGPNTLVWDWDEVSTQAPAKKYQVEMRFEDPEHYRFLLKEHQDGHGWVERTDALFERVKSVPSRFRKMGKPAAEK